MKKENSLKKILFFRMSNQFDFELKSSVVYFSLYFLCVEIRYLFEILFLYAYILSLHITFVKRLVGIKNRE